MNDITPWLWFDTQAEEAATFYTSVFPNSKITDVTRYGPGADDKVMTVSFELNGQKLVGLNGGPEFTFSEAVSLFVSCEGQDEVDELWSKLTDGGEESQCGWLKDKYGLSWQIVPTRLRELLSDPDAGRATRAMEAMLKMKKIEIAELERAAAAA
jgi:predicted 3-demethylubiquinone-9 3-methyltransferase (glyoxalase superfamily)